MSSDDWSREPDDDAGRIAKDRRQAHHAKDAPWITVDQALKIEGTTDDTRLRMELKLALPCRWRDRRRWWRSKAIEDVAPLLGGRNPLDIQDDHFELVIHERFWRERVGKAAATAPPPRTQPQLRDASDDDVRIAMRAIYDKKGEARPDIDEIVRLVRGRLESQGLYAKWETVKRIAREKEFKGRRKRGRPRSRQPDVQPS